MKIKVVELPQQLDWLGRRVTLGKERQLFLVDNGEVGFTSTEQDCKESH